VRIVNGRVPRIPKVYGVFRVATTHPAFHFEEVWHCEPEPNELKKFCPECKFRFQCYAKEEIQVVFRGKTLGIFPNYWRAPHPEPEELEQYLFGKQTNTTIMRQTGGRGKYDSDFD
jgi:hypothetical protein